MLWDAVAIISAIGLEDCRGIFGRDISGFGQDELSIWRHKENVREGQMSKVSEALEMGT